MQIHPIIFLDIDGVLNTPDSWGGKKVNPVDEPKVEMIANLATEIGAKIVVSSSWRIVHTREEMVIKLGDRFDELIVAGNQWRTKSFGGLRGEEIASWLDTNGWRPHAIVDDETDFYRWQPLIKTKGTVGLTKQTIKGIADTIKLQQLEGPVRHGLRYGVGDMLNSPDIIVAHGCNAQGAMGSGAALAVIKRYPLNKVVYQRKHQESGLKLGDVVWYSTYDKHLNNHRIIANCITQEFAGYDGRKYVDYDAVATSYRAVADITLAQGWQQFSTCMVGAGLAGGDWDVLFNILESIAIEKQVTIKVWLLDSQTYYDVCEQYRKFSYDCFGAKSV